VPILSDSQGVAITVLNPVFNAGSAANDGIPDNFTLLLNGANIQVIVNGAVIATLPLASVPQITFAGSSDNDTLTLDFSGGNPVPPAGIVFDGGGPGDSDSITFTGGAPDEVVYDFFDAGSGTVEVDGKLVSYTNLEPIYDKLVVKNRTFRFGNGDDDIKLVLGEDQSVLSSRGSSETVTFANPTVSLKVLAGGGDDTVQVLTPHCVTSDFALVIDGGTGNDFIDASRASFDMMIIGGTGNDLVFGSQGDDILYGGEGNDILVGFGGDDVIMGEAGNDLLDGGSGNDVIYGGDGNDYITGGNGEDILSGDAGNDMIWAGNGNDLVNGGDGNDTLYGENGNDVLKGGKGDDTLLGDNGNDTLYGEEGNDKLYGGLGRDVLNGGPGINLISDNDNKNPFSRKWNFGEKKEAPAPVNTGNIDKALVDLLGEYQYLQDKNGNGKELMDVSASWISDLINSLFDDEESPNNKIKIELPGSNNNPVNHYGFGRFRRR
jgi:Ca2+-binding RTX toxin-like protein